MAARPPEPVDEASTWRPRVGQRVAVRHRLPAGGATDVVGTLLDVPGPALRVQGRDGPVDIVLSDVVAGRVVPPRPVRTAPPHRALAVLDLEAVMALHWRATDREHLGGWLLRASEGFTNRANSALPLGEPGMETDRALDAVRAWYAARDLPARLALPGPAPDGVSGDDPVPGVRAAAEEAGWRVQDGDGALVLTAATAALTTGPDLPTGLVLDVADAPDAGWLAGYRYRGRTPPARAVALLGSAPQQVFASVREAGVPVAVARVSLGGGWAGVTAVEVDPAHRRRGLATALLAAGARWAAGHGARSTYLQVGDANAAAMALYAGAGFAVHHRYDYWTAPS